VLKGRGIRGTVIVNGTMDEVLKSTNTRVTWQANELSSIMFDSKFGDAEMFRRQIYSLSRTYFPPAGYMGVVQAFEFVARDIEFSHAKEQIEASQKLADELGLGEDFDSTKLYLMPSRDGLHFDEDWVYAGVNMLPDDITDGYHFFSAASEFVTHSGYHWLYYGRNRERHKDRWKDSSGQLIEHSHVALARFEEGRLVRLRPVQETGVVVTQTLIFTAATNLTIDVLSLDTSSVLTVELLGNDGSSAQGTDLLTEPATARSVPIRGANGTAEVEWIGHMEPFDGKPVRLRFGLSGACLYGFSLLGM